ncbi:hypothetical protein [Nocardioides marmotae]|uniref:Uncharacterized protein n=1 Tax=Nocardioides marmotae TaxID=2663857 RepID=A0A6I3JEZ8_9ACTN|nr:hypothetical protein [Nocardioides marmotae]MCR6032984.1 hypothetical protein [Gordonia jinghuaiqii]MBC9733515.1 hypothetical protein [Nocardioides marmotae]MTB84622.1 hypothetical protein [Nocardioides marmotae]MTB96635.1 hypothetical protein [Nocardioides marmotae]QKE01855.1 hypothetical protein HPC71_12845 [Nocardioides marmotae]
MIARLLLGALGLALASYGAWLLVGRESDLVDVATWLVTGVLVHDAVLVPVVLVLGLLASRWLPGPARAPAAVGLVVLGSLTLLAVPVLGRFGARADNPTLLDRDYTTGWAVLAGLVVAAVVVASLVRGRARHR